MLDRTRFQIEDKEFDFNNNIQKALNYTSRRSVKELKDTDKVNFSHMSQSVGYYNQLSKRGHPSGRDNYIRDKLIDEVNRTLKAPRKIEGDSGPLQGEGMKIIIPSNVIDNWTWPEVLLGLKLSGHSDTLTETSNLIDTINKKGEIQNERQYRNRLVKFENWLFFSPFQMELLIKLLEQIVFNTRPKIQKHIYFYSRRKFVSTNEN